MKGQKQSSASDQVPQNNPPNLKPLPEDWKSIKEDLKVEDEASADEGYFLDEFGEDEEVEEVIEEYVEEEIEEDEYQDVGSQSPSKTLNRASSGATIEYYGSFPQNPQA